MRPCYCILEGVHVRSCILKRPCLERKFLKQIKRGQTSAGACEAQALLDSELLQSEPCMEKGDASQELIHIKNNLFVPDPLGSFRKAESDPACMMQGLTLCHCQTSGSCSRPLANTR